MERVTFHSAESGYCVLRMKVSGQRDLVTVVGHAAIIAAGKWVQMSGAWINDRTHGLQFRVSFLKASPPTTLEGIEKYLGSGMIRGIGPTYATKLVRAFGAAVFELIEQAPARLREVTGIGPKWAARDIRGIGFLTADRVAEKLGIAKTAMIRVRAGISFALAKAMDEGHCGLPVDELAGLAEKLIEVPPALIEAALTLELAAGEVVADTVEATMLFVSPASIRQ